MNDNCPLCDSSGIVVNKYAGLDVTGVRVCPDKGCRVLEFHLEGE